MSNLTPNTSPKKIERQHDNEVVKRDLDAGDTDDASNEELESLEKTDDNNLKEHPEEVNNDTEDREALLKTELRWFRPQAR